MFDKELIELLLSEKEEELQSLQNAQQPNQDDIDNLTKEINNLKSTIVRYKIAVLLHLDNNPEYLSMNFMGIEEEDINNYNLTQDEITEYNNLISQIPQEQLQRFKIRRQMAQTINLADNEELRNKNYEGIEQINPNLTRYNLTNEQINEFNNLLNSLNALADDTTKSIDFSTIKLLENAFNKLNLADHDEYNRIKDQYLETIDKLLNHISDEQKASVFSSVSNYEFASDLSEKYPNMNVKLNMDGVTKLLRYIESLDINDEKYDYYIELLCNNINELYQTESNKRNIEDLINQIDNTKYTLRHDLKEKLSNIENNHLDLQDGEIESFAEYLDSNYDTLSESERDKCYNLLESKINDKVKDINNIEDINQVLQSINNKNLATRLQSKFSSNHSLKFSHKHLSSYQELVKSEIQKLEAKKSKYISKRDKGGPRSTHYNIKIKEIDKAIEKLKSIEVDYENKRSINRLDEKYNHKTDKIVVLEQEISELKALKEQINSKFRKRRIDKKIEKRNQKIQKLQNSKIKIVGKQKKKMAPRLWVNSKKGKMARHYEAKSETFQEYADDYRNMAQTEINMNKMFSGIKALFYEHKANKYQNKADFNAEICNLLNSRQTRINGRNRRRINPDVLRQVRQNHPQQIPAPAI